MASRPDRTPWWATLAAGALSALAWWFGSGLQPHWWLTWLAPLPLLWLAPRIRARWAALVAFMAFGLGGLNQWSYLHERIHLPMPVTAYVIAMAALTLVPALLLFRRLLRRGHPLAAALGVPVVWVAIEYISSLLSPHGTFGSIAYTQMDALPVIQLAAITGLWGVSFLVLLVPAAIAVQTARQASRRGRTATAALTLLLLAATLGYGAWRLQLPATRTLRIGLVSLEHPIRPALDSPAGQALQARYVQAIGRLADAGAQVVVIPETAFATAGTSVPVFADLARQRRLILDVGIDGKADPHAERNLAMALQPHALAPATYSKHHLIPGFENQYAPGAGYSLLDGAPRIGLAICKDMDFHDIGRAYAARDAQLLLVPAWDFGVDGWLHSRMAIMRGVESGFAIARVARSGRLTLSDDRGRVLAEASSETHDAARVDSLPLRETHTLHGRWGDWFAWLDLAALLGLLGLALRSERPRER